VTPPTPEQQFARYRDTGDLSALAAVFDAVAGRLLLVAGHLVRDGALAEDLVQTTFVEAMRSAPHYDARRPLVPWLAQILTHHARKLHRQRQREERRRPLGARDERSAVEHVLSHEAMAAIQAGLARLSPTYQQVLTLRLVHGLPPAAIAHALGCPPETVKTRLKRGLDQLRRHLPAGLATSIAVMLASGRGLAAVRTDVLLRARHLAGKAAGAGTVAAVVSGGLIMKQVLFVGAAILVVLALGLWGTAAWGPTRTPPDPAPHAAAAAVGGIVSEPATTLAVERQTLATAVTPPSGIVFVGRCVAEHTGVPLDGVTAVVRRWTEEREVCDNELAAEPALARATSGPDGRFELPCERIPGAIYDLRVGNAEHVHRVRSFGPYEQDQTVDLGDAVLPLGVHVSLTVVDRRGAPVADVRITGSRSVLVGRSDMLMLDTGWPWRSDARGEIHLPYAMWPGRYDILWWGDRLPAGRSLTTLEVPGDQERHHAVLVWPVEDVRHSLEGEVVDESGRPIPGLNLVAHGGGTRGIATTLADGTFRMPRIGPYDANDVGPVEFALTDPTCGLELLAAPTCGWGDRGVRLLARATATLVVRAIDATTGAPVHDVDVVCAAHLDAAASPKTVSQRFGGSANERRPDGSVRRRLPRCAHDVQVFPKDPRLAPSFRFVWDPRDGDEVVVPLTPVRWCTVLVTTHDGEPVADTELWTLQPIEAVAGSPAPSDWQTVATPVADEQRLDPTTRWMRHGIDDAPLGTARTGADGRARLPVPADADVVLAALGPGHVPTAIVGRATDDTVELRVQRGAALRLVLTPKDVALRLAPSPRQQLLRGAHPLDAGRGGLSLQVQRVESEPVAEAPQASFVVPLAADGSCEHHGLPPGRYAIALAGFVESGAAEGIMVQREFEPVVLREGQICEIPLDVSCWALGRLRGQVLVNGQPWACGDGQLWWLRWPKKTVVSVRTDAAGCFDVEVPVEGDYRLQLLGLHQDGYYSLAAEVVQVTAGTTTSRVFHCRDVSARARIVHATGEPAAGLTVTTDYRTEPISSHVSWVTDADGWITIQPAPPVPFQLIVTNPSGPLRAGRRGSSSGDASLGPFQVPPIGDRAEFRAVLPEDWR